MVSNEEDDCNADGGDCMVATVATIMINDGDVGDHGDDDDAAYDDDGAGDANDDVMRAMRGQMVTMNMTTDLLA